MENYDQNTLVKCICWTNRLFKLYVTKFNTFDLLWVFKILLRTLLVCIYLYEAIFVYLRGAFRFWYFRQMRYYDGDVCLMCCLT